MRMSKDGDHHYIPKFHLKKWSRPDGRLTTWKRIAHTGKIFRERKFPSEFGKAEGLYSLKHVPDDQTQAVERLIFSQEIDNTAAPVLENILAGRMARLSPQELMDWAKYLNASTLRLPGNVAKLRESTEKHLHSSFSESQKEYEELRGSAPEPTLVEFVRNRSPQTLANLAIEVMVGLIPNQKLIDRFLSLRWITRDFTGATKTLLLGDNPLLYPRSLLSGPTLIAMPLSPTVLFVATDSYDFAKGILEANESDIIIRANEDSIKSADELVFGDAEPAFIERHFCKFDYQRTPRCQS